MMIRILQENLIKALTRTGRVISSKTQLPILQNILLRTKDGMLEIIASNLETTEIVKSGTKIEKPGALCVSSKLLTEFVLSLPQETVTLEETDQQLLISCGRYKATIPTIPSSEFPPTQEGIKLNGKGVESGVFLTALEDVLFSAATDEGRPLLTGVKIISEEKNVSFAATDGYRLSVTSIETSAPLNLSMVVPARALGEVVKTIHEEKEIDKVSLAKSEDGQLVCSVGDTYIVTRLLEGEYPSYTKIIPKTHTTQLVTDKGELQQAVRSASIFARDNANIIRFHIESGLLVVSANTPQVGENRIEVEGETEGEGGDIAFNSRFLLDFLSHFGSERVIFKMTGSLNPGVFQAPDKESYLHVIMPVRVQG